MPTLLSLISEQTLPNILFAKEKGTFDRYIFISTAEMEKREKTKAILNVLNLGSLELIKKIVLEDSIQDIQSKLAEIDFSESEQITINLTGGNKVMGLATYEFFKQKPCTEIFYIPFPKNQIIKIYPEQADKLSELLYRISLKEYLDSYGVKVSQASFQNKNQVFQQALTEAIFQKNRQESSGDAQNFRNLWRALRDKQTETVLQNQGFIDLQSPVYLSVNQGLNELAYTPQTPNQLSNAEVQYFAGGWWEEYVYHFIQKTATLSDDAIGLNIEINRDNRAVLQAANEFDILFVKDNRLYVIECKTGIKDLRKSGIQTFNEYVYKLAALRKFFGLSVKLILFISQPLTKNRSFFDERTNVLNIQLFDGQEAWSNPDKLIQDILK